MGPSNASERIPFRVTVEHPLLVVDASIREHGPYSLVIDTGASMTVITRRTARKAGVARLDAPPGSYAVTAGGRSDFELGRIDELTIGGTCVRNVDVGIMKLGALSKAVGLRVDGVLGYNVLKAFRLTIDYSQGYMLLEQSAQPSTRRGAQ